RRDGALPESIFKRSHRMKPPYLNALRILICAFALGVENESVKSASAADTTLTSQLQEISENEHLRMDFDDGSVPMFGGGTGQAEGETIRLPDTPAGKTLGEFIKAFNTGDLETLKRFHKERGGDEENARQDMGFYHQTGGLKLHSVKRSEQFE